MSDTNNILDKAVRHFANLLGARSLDDDMEDYFNNGVQVAALQPTPEKLEQIAKIMAMVRKTVMANAERQREELRKMGSYDPRDEKNIVEGLKRINDKAIYRMQVPEEAFEKVVKSKDGRFKNLFETRTSGGNRDYQGRAKTSSRNFGTPVKTREYTDYDWEGRPVTKTAFNVSTKALKDSEKYGYIVTDPSDGVSKDYGEYYINFAPENVKHRTTFTHDDSMNNRRFYPIMLDDPERTGIGLTGNVEQFNEAYPEGKATRDVFKKYMEQDNTRLGYNLMAMDPKGRYMEAQYHGPLGLDDVESVMVPSGTYIGDALKRKADLNHFDVTDYNGNVLYKWGTGK